MITLKKRNSEIKKYEYHYKTSNNIKYLHIAQAIANLQSEDITNN